MEKEPLVDVSVRVEIRMRSKNFANAEDAARRIIHSCKLEAFEEITHVAPYSINTVSED